MPAGVNEEEMKHFGALAQADYDRVNKVQVVGIQSGHFERMENLVGMEEALCAFYECPGEIDAFFDAMTEFKIEMFRQIKKYYNPDVVSPHDDWGTNLNMFFSPEMWRKHVKRHIKRMVDAAHELGMLYEQHTCGYITPIFGDLVECGVDMAEIQAINDLKYIKENYGSQIVLRGCFPTMIKAVPLSLLIFCGAVVIFGSIFNSADAGISVALNNVLAPITGNLSPFILCAIAYFLCLVLTNFVSNTVAMILFFSICIPALAGTTVSNVAVTITLCIIANFASLVPSAAVTAPLFFGDGHITVQNTLKWNIIMIMLAFLVSILVIYPLGNLVL